MAGQRRRRALRERLLRAGFSLSPEGPEEDRVVHQWLRDDLRRPPPDWCASLPHAVETARFIYRTFTDTYATAFLQPFGWGCQLVRRHLSRDWLFTDGRMEEAVLNRIRDRRLVLMYALRRKYQGSLFGPQTFDPTRLRGYLRRVARLESLKVPQADLPWSCTALPPEIGEICSSGPEDGIDYRDLTQRLSAFWSEGNGFAHEHFLEGVISLGLGSLVPDEDLQRRSDAGLANRLPNWERTLERLRRRASRLLEVHELTRERRAFCSPGEEAALDWRLAELEERLQSCREKLARHPSRLRPRPGEVCDLLDGLVRNPSTVRHDRIRREIVLFRRHAEDSWADVGPHPPASVTSLKRAIDSHLGSRPPSPRMHGLDDGERGRRRRMARDWLERAANLLHWIRALAAEHRSVPLLAGEGAAALDGWLFDIEDLYEFGVLAEKGVIHALGKRHGRRLLHLLRPGPRQASAKTPAGRRSPVSGSEPT